MKLRGILYLQTKLIMIIHEIMIPCNLDVFTVSQDIHITKFYQYHLLKYPAL